MSQAFSRRMALDEVETRSALEGARSQIHGAHLVRHGGRVAGLLATRFWCSSRVPLTQYDGVESSALQSPASEPESYGGTSSHWINVADVIDRRRHPPGEMASISPPAS